MKKPVSKQILSAKNMKLLKTNFSFVLQKNMRLLSDIRLKGSKVELIVPLILLLVLNLIAVINLECCIIAFLVFPVIIASSYIWFAKKYSR